MNQDGLYGRGPTIIANNLLNEFNGLKTEERRHAIREVAREIAVEEADAFFTEVAAGRQ